jgi:hypothetical protein
LWAIGSGNSAQTKVLDGRQLEYLRIEQFPKSKGGRKAAAILCQKIHFIAKFHKERTKQMN